MIEGEGLALYASEALIFWYGAHLVNEGTFTLTKVIKVLVVLVITTNSLAETASLALKIIRGGEAVGSVFSILDEQSNCSSKMDPDDVDEAKNVESVRGKIELCHVDFVYPS
ncbi:ABC transporter B family member 19 [Olea europaea subsp. europaea]|uniref:ABC transporter B family member 19 n=1 Tax=Olea europaea subsp. europaea TaxID=158383 RepID=A0A8S0PLK4_OLEEU|nr:ABC transporter B family member 19 [Olea europaea subsp. europaea]